VPTAFRGGVAERSGPQNMMLRGVSCPKCRLKFRDVRGPMEFKYMDLPTELSKARKMLFNRQTVFDLVQSTARVKFIAGEGKCSILTRNARNSALH
jgi:hypothetical protein